ncbi:sulfate transport system ATP-binding protein [Burkholderiales bacterium]|nr:sulfate transport system ATP-binding protein [Burkholderiales bacterium]
MNLSLAIGHDAPPLDLDVVLPAGEIVAVVGPSGSGKTSLLRAVAGLMRPRRGRIALDGDVWLDAARGVSKPTRERPIGYVSQHYGLFPHLSALANVACSLTHLPPRERHARARACLELAHVAGLDDRLPRELSGGQQQRVAMARALAREPRLLLLDEPFSSVDRSTRKRLYVELKRLHAELAATVLLVTHDLDEAALLATHLCLIQRGRIVQHGAAGDVLTRPSTVAAARLLDLPNLFTGTVEGGGAGSRLRWGPHVLEAPAAAAFAPGADVAWTILPTRVLLHRVDRPSRGESENPVGATIADLVTLGDDVIARLVPDGLPDDRLHLKVSLHVARRNGLAPGRAVAVSLLADAIVPLASD